MKYELPTVDDLKTLAGANHFELSEEELEAFQAMLPGLFDNYELLEKSARAAEHPEPLDRDTGHRPPPADDPWNAILRRCELRGAASGKLVGKRIGLKDSVSVAGLPMTCGSMLLDGFVSDTDATIVTRLLEAGGQIVAKLNMDNLALSGGGDTSAFGAVLNPHNPAFLAGGSSGGSAAALYYDDIDVTIGSDQGGSIRIPASWCGVVGLKPTHGLVPYTGIVGADNTFDHTGPMARTVEEVATTLEVIAGKDPLDPRQGEVPVQPYTEALGRGVEGLGIGMVTEGFGLASSEPDVDAAVRQSVEAFGEMGANVSEVSIPSHSESGGVAWGLIVEGIMASLQSNGMGHHWEGLYSPRLAKALGESLRSRSEHIPAAAKLVLLIGSYLSDRYHGRPYALAQNMRRPLRASYDRALEQLDVLAMPTTPMKALKHEPDVGVEDLIRRGWSMADNTAPFDMTGHPAISIPCGMSHRLPVGMMLVAKRFDDATLIRAAHAFEQHVDWETLP